MSEKIIGLKYDIAGILYWLDKPGHITKFQKAVISGLIKELCHRLKDKSLENNKPTEAK